MDRTAVTWLAAHRVEWLDALFVGLTFVGYAGLVWIAIAPLAARRSARSTVRSAIVVAIAVWSADLLALGLKALIDRPRPVSAIEGFEPLVGGTVGSSMPSGHAATSAAGLVVLVMLTRRLWPLVALLAVGIAFSRVYVGAHYPSDVMAGLAIGAVAGLAAARWILPGVATAAPTARCRRATGSDPRS